MAKQSKTMTPAPVYVANYTDGITVRMSFSSPIGKPLDLARGKKLCDLVRASAAFDAGPGAKHVKKIKDNAARAEAKLAERILADWNLLSEKTRAGDTLEQFAGRVRYSAEYDHPVSLADVESHARAKAEFVQNYQAPASTGDQVYHPSFGLQSIADMVQPETKAKAPTKQAARLAFLEQEYASIGALLDGIRLEIAECIDADATLGRISDLIGRDRARKVG